MMNFLLPSSHDLLRDPGDLGFLKRFLHQKDVPHALTGNAVVQITDIGNVHFLRPFLRFLLHLEDFFLRGEWRDHGWSLTLRQFQDKALIIKLEVKIFHIAGMICHISVKIIVIISDTVNIHLGNTAVPKQFLLVIHMMTVEQCDRLICIDRTFTDRDFRLRDLMHLCSDLIQKFPIQSCKSIYRKIIAGSDRIMDLYFLNRVLARHIVDCFEQYKAGTSLVGRKSNVVSGRDKFYLTVTLDSLVKFPKPPSTVTSMTGASVSFWYS